MGKKPRDPLPQQPSRPSHPDLPPCEQAQADGVPCTEVGRQCEICEHAYPEWRAARQGDGDRG